MADGAQFTAELSQITDLIPKAVGLVRNMMAFTLVGDIKDESVLPNWRVDTGFSRAAWHAAPVPVEEIVLDEQHIAESLAAAEQAGEQGHAAVEALSDPYAPLYVGCSANYASFLEFGTIHHAPDLVATTHVQQLEQKAEALIEKALAGLFPRD